MTMQFYHIARLVFQFNQLTMMRYITYSRQVVINSVIVIFFFLFSCLFFADVDLLVILFVLRWKISIPTWMMYRILLPNDAVTNRYRSYELNSLGEGGFFLHQNENQESSFVYPVTSYQQLYDQNFIQFIQVNVIK